MYQKARRQSLIGSLSLLCLGFLLFPGNWGRSNRDDRAAAPQAPQAAGLNADALMSMEEAGQLFSAQPTDRVGMGTNDPIRKALALGIPLRISIRAPKDADQAADEFDLYLRPMQALAERFQITLGADFDRRLESEARVFEGWAVSSDSRSRRGRATLALVEESLGAVIRSDDGECIELRSDPATGRLLALPLGADSAISICSIERVPEGTLASTSSELPACSEDDWLAAEIAPQWGGDPATGEITKYEQPIPNAPLYDLSLPEATVMVVLAKDATGSDSATHLASLASTYLARMANIATIWENQLGIRLLVSELILTPDTPAYEDVGEALGDFRLWGESHRPRSQFPRSVAVRFGNLGFSGSVIGRAFLRGVAGSGGYSIVKTNYNFTLTAHEMGHNFGSDHSSGGIMNASYLGGQRDFFRDVTAGETAAKEIYDHAYSRLYGPATMRHPEEIPFAQDDSRGTEVNTPLLIEPLENDDGSVPNGAANELSILELSRVYPIGAGTAELAGDSAILFTPAPDFEGFAWFSYSLQGDVGNDSKGWLHRGDVAVLVGADLTDPQNITLAPGESIIFAPPGSGSASIQTQATQAQVDVTRDDTNYLLIRAAAGAAGTDSFVVRRSSQNYTINITYQAHLPLSVGDVIFADTGATAVRFNPMSNDDAIGYRRPLQIGARIGVDGATQNFFPNAFRLVSATNRNPEKGSLALETIGIVSGGSNVAALTGNMTFTPVADASGVARIDYVIEDAAGNLATGTVSVILSTLEVNRAPSITPIADFPDFALPSFTLQVAASDPDVPANQLQFFLDEKPPGATITPDGGVIEWTPTAAGTYHFTVRVDDQGIPNLSDSESFSVVVTNAAPVIENQSFSLAENSPAGTEIGTIVADDGDGDGLSFSISGGDPDGAITIEPSSGLMTVNSSAALDFETRTTLNLAVEVSDDATPPLSRTATVTVQLTDVNEAPELPNQALDANDGASFGTLLGTITATDPENATLSYAIVSGNEAGIFALDPFTGALSIAAQATLSHPAELTVSATDPGSPPLAAVGTVTVAISLPLVPHPAGARVLVPSDNSLSATWTATSFDDSTWVAGPTGIGFGGDIGFAPLIGTDVEAAMFNANSSIYIRIPFTVADAGSIDSLALRINYDDGFVAFLNGQELVRSNAPQGMPDWDAAAVADRDTAQALQSEEFDLTPFLDRLETGDNVLAIHGLNNRIDSDDLLILPELLATGTGTIGLPALAELISGSATGVSTTDALLEGDLVSNGGEDPEIIAVWGTTDGGTDPALWQHTKSAGIAQEGTFSVPISGFLADTAYFFRFYAVNGAGTAWAPRSGTFTANSVQLDQPLIGSSSEARVLIPGDATDATEWRTLDYDDDAWQPGLTGIGYETSSGYQQLIATDVEAAMFNQNPTVYIRLPFALSDPASLSSLTLRMKYDDAFVAFINGVEIARSANAPATLPWDAQATSSRSDTDAVTFEDTDILAAAADGLVGGENILAIHGLNAGANSSDLLFIPELIATVPESSFAGWIAGFPQLEGDDRLPDRDPDFDQLSNFYEWATGWNPSIPETDIPELAPLVRPEIRQPTTGESNELAQIRFRRRIDYLSHGLRYEVQQTEELTPPEYGWGAAFTEPIDDPVPTGDGISEIVTLRITGGPNMAVERTPSKQFFRLVISRGD